jgi:nucleotide-binding universal stress UspA family protein
VQTTILVGTDGTARAEIAVDRAAALAASTKARLVVLSVVQPPAITSPLGPRGIDAVVALDRERRQAAELAVRTGYLTAKSHGVEATLIVRTGDPAQQIIAVADETDANTIVIGDRGLEPSGPYVLSSVPASVAIHARQHDVLVVRTATTIPCHAGSEAPETTVGQADLGGGRRRLTNVPAHLRPWAVLKGRPGELGSWFRRARQLTA